MRQVPIKIKRRGKTKRIFYVECDAVDIDGPHSSATHGVFLGKCRLCKYHRSFNLMHVNCHHKGGL